MSFTPKYVTVRVSGIGQVTNVPFLCKDGVVYEEDVLKAAQEAFEPFGGLKKRPKKVKKVPSKEYK